MRYLIVFIFSLVMLSVSFANWTGPTLLLEARQWWHANVLTSAYRDPVSLTNHVLIHNESNDETLHLAVDDQGAVVGKTVLGKTCTPAAVIRGDEKHLLAALAFRHGPGERTMINFTESMDGGRTWTPVKWLALGEGESGLLDMVYMAETGRVLIFLQNRYSGIYVSNRAPPDPRPSPSPRSLPSPSSSYTNSPTRRLCTVRGWANR